LSDAFTDLRFFRQFHFATVLSPWIRRALIAGNFGTGAPCPTHEIAAVVPYRGGYKDSRENEVEISHVDIETLPARNNKSEAYGPNGDFLIDTHTPFFHFDLLAAVRAAESGLSRRPSEVSQGSDSKAKDT
jgi:solute carrier family 26 (sodium-independent sulfate anion transporter), member 11